MLPDFSREDIKYEDVRRKNTSSSAEIYKIDFDFATPNTALTKPIVPTSSKIEISKKKNHNANSGKAVSTVRTQCATDKKEKGDKKIYEKETIKCTKNGEIERKSTTVATNPSLIIKQEPDPPKVTTENQNLLRDWVALSDSQLVDAKTLENTLQNDFVNGFDINSSTIQSQIQDIINSEPSLSTDILMGSNELPNYIQVEGWLCNHCNSSCPFHKIRNHAYFYFIEMIEEVEITDETLESNELNNHELVHSEDLNAVLKQLPPEAFNELFSGI